jgi:hypothetical protein
MRDQSQTAVDWEAQRAEFARDGSLRDIYVLDATATDWRAVLSLIFDVATEPRLQCVDKLVEVPAELESLFREPRHLLTFAIAGVAVTCHFFSLLELEFSFAPDAVTQTTLPALLSFMCNIGEATRKRVILSHENLRESPLFSYEPGEQRLRWHPR